MSYEPDPWEGMPDPPDEPEALPTANALVELCVLLGEKHGFNAGFSASDRPGGFCFNPWDNDIAINYKGQEFILSLRPSNRIV